jgi:heme-degrading monooxygenase HmoA
MTARILVFAKVAADEADAFEKAYLQVTERMQGTPGLIGDELLRDASGTGEYILLSEWESIEQFKKWEEGDSHRETTVAMRPYWAGTSEFRIYDLAARLTPPR